MTKNVKQSYPPGWPLTNQTWEVKVQVWGRMALGEKDSEIVRWLQFHPPELDRDTVRKIRKELLPAPDHVLPEMPEMVRKYRDTLLAKQRGQDSVGKPPPSVEKGDINAAAVSAQRNPKAAPNLNAAPGRAPPLPAPLTLKVTNYEPSVSKDRFGDYHLSLTTNLEVTARRQVRVAKCVLIMGGGPISEYSSLPNQGKLLGEKTWHPTFCVPEWVQAGVYTVCIGALLAKTLEPSPYLRPVSEWLGVGGEEDEYVKSNGFEVSIPELPPPDAAMKAALKAAVQPQFFSRLT